MKQTSAHVLTVPTRFVADTQGARYERYGEVGAVAAGQIPGGVQLASVAVTDGQALGGVQPESVEPVARSGRIVVGVDGSEESVDALRRGVRIAEALNASVEAISTWRIPTGFATMGEVEYYSPADDATAILSGAAKSVFGAQNPDWFTSAIFQGDAADVLVEHSQGAEMLVVGSRGHGGIAGLLLGSVSAKCAERAHCPVLIMH